MHMGVTLLVRGRLGAQGRQALPYQGERATRREGLWVARLAGAGTTVWAAGGHGGDRIKALLSPLRAPMAAL